MERQRKVTYPDVLLAGRLASSDGLGARGWPRAGGSNSERAAILLMAERWACPHHPGRGLARTNMVVMATGGGRSSERAAILMMAERWAYPLPPRWGLVCTNVVVTSHLFLPRCRFGRHAAIRALAKDRGGAGRRQGAGRAGPY